ncbi:MAG: hypothetical protein RMJ56_09540 [Gemmataceae bacterium]|nr:hypothetical protein [Gemmata sp.]MDW8197832.1 hypothetical protein [Gemmataceae bacterium]
MYALLFSLLATTPTQAPAGSSHENLNALYKKLTHEGLDVGGKAKAKFPPPTMPDGLTPAQQTAVIAKLIEKNYTYDQFTRNSTVAPQMIKIEDLPDSDPKNPARAVSVWFLAYCDFKKLDDDRFLERIMNANKGTGSSGGELKPTDLQKRGLTISAGNENRESYGFVEFDFLDKVRIKVTGHAIWSRTEESVVAAAEIDPRFNNDKEFPNEWRSLTKQGGQLKVGEPQPWSGAAMYVKITKLQEPKGALFVEQHVIYQEPAGWFGAPNYLRAKLPPAVTDNVRKMRAEIQK